LKFHNKTIAILYSWLHRNLKEGIGWPGSFMSVTSDYKPNTTGVCLSPITPQVLRFLDTYCRSGFLISVQAFLFRYVLISWYSWKNADTKMQVRTHSWLGSSTWI